MKKREREKRRESSRKKKMEIRGVSGGTERRKQKEKW